MLADRQMPATLKALACGPLFLQHTITRVTPSPRTLDRF
jgi:hypothetical protein